MWTSPKPQEGGVLFLDPLSVVTREPHGMDTGKSNMMGVIGFHTHHSF